MKCLEYLNMVTCKGHLGGYMDAFNSKIKEDQRIQVKLHLQIRSLNFCIPSHYISLGINKALKCHFEIYYFVNVEKEFSMIVYYIS